MRPVPYPAAIAAAYVLNLLVETGVSPYAAARPLVLAIVIGLTLPWLGGLVAGHRDVAGLLGGILLFVALATPSPAIVILASTALVLILLHRVLAQRGAESRAAGERLWPVVTRALTALALFSSSPWG